MKSLFLASFLVLLVNGAAEDFSESTSSGGESSESRVPVPTPGCQWETVNGTMYSDLGHFAPINAANISANGSLFFRVSPCASMIICSNEVGYAAVVDENGDCVDVYSVVKQAVTFDSRAPARYTEVLQTTHLKKTLSLVFQCNKNANGTYGRFTAGALTIEGYQFCPSPVQKSIPVPNDQCSVDFTQFNGEVYTATMPNWSNRRMTLDNAHVAISLCGPVQDSLVLTNKTGAECPSTPGYMAYPKKGSCVVLDQRAVTYDPNLLQFTAVFNSSTSSDASSSRVVILKCGELDSTSGMLEGGNTVTYTSRGACGIVSQQAPKAKKEPPPNRLWILIVVVGLVALCTAMSWLYKRFRDKKVEGEGTRLNP